MPEPIELGLVFNDTQLLEGLQRIANQMKSIEDSSKSLTDRIIDDMTKGAKASEDFGKKLDDAAGDVDNAKKSLDNSSDSLDNHKKRIIDAAKSYKIFGISIADLEDRLKDLKLLFKGVETSTKGASKGMRFLGKAIVATGIGILIIVLGSLIAFFKRTSKGAEKLRVVFKQVGAVVDVFANRVAALGEIFLNLGKVFSEQGLFGAIKSLGPAFSGVSQEMKDQIVISKALEEQLIRLEKAQLGLTISTIEQRKEIELLNRIGADTTKTIEDRTTAIEKAGNISTKIITDQINVQKDIISNLVGEVGKGVEGISDKTKLSLAGFGIAATRILTENITSVEDFETRSASILKQIKDRAGKDVDLTELTSGIEKLQDLQFAQFKQELDTQDKIKGLDDEAKKRRSKHRDDVEALRLLFEKLALTLEGNLEKANIANLEGGEKIVATYRLAEQEIGNTQQAMLDLFLEMNKGKGTADELTKQFNDTFGPNFVELLEALKLKTRKELAEVDVIGSLDVSAGAATAAEQAKEAAKLVGKKFKIGFREGLDDDLFKSIPVDEIAKPIRTIEDVLTEIGGKIGKFYDDIGADALNATISVIGSLNEVTRAQIDQQDALIDALNGRIDAQQEKVDEQLQLAEDGFANNLDAEKAYLEELQAQRSEADAKRLELAKKAANQQLVIDTASQISSLATSAANIFAAESPKGLLGILFAITAITSMFALFAKAKAQAKTAALAPQLREGAQLQGASHESGGIPLHVQGNMYEAEGGEWLIGTRPSKEHSTFLDRLNANEFSGVNLDALVSKRESPINGLVASAMHTHNQRQTVESGMKWVILKEAYLQGSKEIVKAINEQPTVHNGQILTKRGNTLQRKTL